ncbi:hypothetical protein [Kitasatospora sp. NPDC059827]|uniref:hypothetical protein n=1 Tax=unclassified Kitasatospora TaxID=2633591 RepID=UPI003668DD88
MTEIVPADFTVPRELLAPEFRLEPLGEQHNASDHAAWTWAGPARTVGRAVPGHAPRRVVVGRRCSAWTPSSALRCTHPNTAR